ncbi:MAG: hypothetical protein ACOYJL_09850 [Tractidigestivibacter sp.]|jgi:hypothetical protein|uniref:hypothetical protein n=1 Tax=Tractidigestivibacter sp. TaxID=2847320 RepID=UPI003D89B20C
MLALVVIVLCVWLLAELAFGAPTPDARTPRVGASAYGWLVVGSIVFSLVMARLGFPFVFLVFPPIFFVFGSGRKTR